MARTETAPTIIGVDPGSRWTGVVIVSPAGLLRAHTTLSRRNTVGDTVWLPTLWTELATFLNANVDALEGDVVAALEDVVAPTTYGRKANGDPRLTNTKHAIDTAKVFGYLMGKLTEHHAGRVVVIRPNKHGDRHEGVPSMMHALYPPELIGARETTGNGHGRMHHQRAAWDVADTARHELRIEAMRR